MWKLKLLFLLSFSSFALSSDFTSLPPLKWVKPIKDITVSPKSIFEVSGNSFLCNAGKNFALIDASDGSLIKTAAVSAKVVGQTLEKGFIGLNANTLIVFNADFEQLWSKTIADSNVALVSAIQTSDSGYVAIGNVSLTDSAGIQMIRINKNNAIVWTKRISSICINPQTTGELGGKNCSFVLEGNGGYFVCGKSIIVPNIWNDGWIAKYSDNGTEEWIKIIDGLTIFDFISVQEGIALTGNQDISLGKPGLLSETAPMKILGKRMYFPAIISPFFYFNAQGEKIASADIGRFGSNWGSSIRKFKDTFIAAIYSGPDNKYPMAENKTSIIALNETGQKKWSKDYLVKSSTSPLAQPLSSGDLVVFALDSLYYYSTPTNAFVPTNKDGFSSQIKLASINVCGRSHYFLNQSSRVAITLFAANGTMVRIIEAGPRQAGKHDFSISDLAPGAYVMKFQCNNQLMLQTIVRGQ
jgi:hypothetical protein